VSRVTALFVGFWLFGAAVGAALTGVGWSFWAFWALTWFGLIRLVWGHRGNGGHAHA